MARLALRLSAIALFVVCFATCNKSDNNKKTNKNKATGMGGDPCALFTACKKPEGFKVFHCKIVSSQCP